MRKTTAGFFWKHRNGTASVVQTATRHGKELTEEDAAFELHKEKVRRAGFRR